MTPMLNLIFVLVSKHGEPWYVVVENHEEDDLTKKKTLHYQHTKNPQHLEKE